jgi:peroxiredoxin
MCHLQELSEAYREQGLVVIGLNCSDDVKIAREFLAENKATFEEVLDASPATIRTVFTDYQTLSGMSAVPLSYIIDREGKIAAGWYGKHDEKRLSEVLSKLGLKE